MDFDYDLFVIGGGSGGVRAARMAGQTGAKVAIAEADRYGGTCVIRGCVPKKLMVFASEFAGLPATSEAYGWDLSLGAFNWPAFSTKLNTELDRLEQIYRNLLSGSGVDAFDARARIEDPHKVTLSTGQSFTAKHILVATGGHPVRPDMPNAALGLVSDDIFHLPEMPASILIVGGGYIACEFACILAGLGVRVTQYYRGAQILRGFDEEARGIIAEGMRDKGIALHVGTNILEMGPADQARGPAQNEKVFQPSLGLPAGERAAPQQGAEEGPLWVKASNGTEAVFDAVMFATGRAPNTADMGLEEAGVNIGRRGEIVVDAFSQTSVPSIYAIGDVTDRVQLTPVALAEGMVLARHLYDGQKGAVDYSDIPTCVFSQPNLGTVGLTEEEARDQYPHIEIYKSSFKPMKLTLTDSDEKTLMKMIVDKDTDRVVGVHMLGPDAGEIIQGIGIAIKAGATKQVFDSTIGIHPTAAEEFVTMREPVSN